MILSTTKHHKMKPKGGITMTITTWTNQIQEAVIQEWMKGCQEGEGTQDIQALRNGIAKRYGLTVSAVRGIVELGATEGLSRTRSEAHLTDGHSWEPINYHELVGDLKERTRTLERKFEYLLDGIEKVLTDGETMAIHLGNLRQMGRWMKKRDALDMREMTRAPLDENKDPPLLEIEPQNKPGKKEKRTEIKTKSRPTYNELGPMEKIERLSNQADNAFKRGGLLFREIEETEEGKKAITR